MQPVETLLTAIALLLVIEFVGICVLIYWTHKRDNVIKLFEEKIKEIIPKEIEHNEKTDTVKSKPAEVKAPDTEGEEEEA